MIHIFMILWSIRIWIRFYRLKKCSKRSRRHRRIQWNRIIMCTCCLEIRISLILKVAKNCLRRRFGRDRCSSCLIQGITLWLISRRILLRWFSSQLRSNSIEKYSKHTTKHSNKQNIQYFKVHNIISYLLSSISFLFMFLYYISFCFQLYLPQINTIKQ